MNAKKALTIVLLVFVASSLITMVLKEFKRPSARATPGPVQTPPSDTAPKLIAYYLHGKVRCVTCNEIETSAKAAIEDGFGSELSSGRLEWRVVNYDEPGNEHFATDFDIAAPCVVLASMRDGRQVAWKSLPEVWELIDDKPAFKEFVQKSVREQLDLKSPALTTPAGARPASADTAAPAVAATANLPRLLDLGAGKCIPCKKMAPVLEALKQEKKGRLDVVFIDVWEDPTQAEKYGVSTIPTQIFFDPGGRELFRHEGFFSREEILAKWKELKISLGDAKKL